MSFGAPNDDAVRAPFDNPEVEVGVGLGDVVAADPHCLEAPFDCRIEHLALRHADNRVGVSDRKDIGQIGARWKRQVQDLRAAQRDMVEMRVECAVNCDVARL
jgi:hypothetical protein